MAGEVFFLEGELLDSSFVSAEGKVKGKSAGQALRPAPVKEIHRRALYPTVQGRAGNEALAF